MGTVWRGPCTRRWMLTCNRDMAPAPGSVRPSLLAHSKQSVRAFPRTSAHTATITATMICPTHGTSQSNVWVFCSKQFFYCLWIPVAVLQFNLVLTLRRASLVAQEVKKLPAMQETCRRSKFTSWLGKIPWRRAWQPIQYSCLGNFMDGGAWWAAVHGVAKESDTTE